MKNQFLLSIYLCVCLLVFTTCSKTTKETKEKIVQIQNESAAASFVPTFPTESLNESVNSKITSKTAKKSKKPSNIPARKFEGKKIPFNELLKANISFTENKGQLERFEHFSFPELGSVKFYTKAFCGNAYFGNKGIGFGFQRGALRDVDVNVNKVEKVKMSKVERKEMIGFSIDFIGSNEKVQILGEEEQHTKINYLKGNDPNAFVTDISSFEKVHYKQLYKGIDLIYYNKSNQLKYDYVLAPKADVHQIKMSYNDVKHLEINEKGELEVEIDWGVLVDKKPFAYQMVNGKKKEIKVDYELIDKSTLGFEIKGDYDATKELVIDPFTVAWSTYIGTGTTEDGYIEATCIDNTGRTLGTGWTNNAFPINGSANGYDKSYNGGTDAYVFRLNANATALDYVTFLGGSGNETGTGILINSLGEICVSGYTNSYSQYTFVENSPSSLTVTTGSVNVNVPGGIGSYGFGADIILTNGANSMVGNITGFADGVTLIVNFYSVSGSGTHSPWALSKVIQSPFPTSSGAIQSSKTGNDGNDDIFYVKLNGSGNNLTYGTYYGGTTSLVDWAIDLALDASNNAYIVGRTESNVGFSTSGVYKTAAQGGYDGYLLKINANGTLGYCTYIGGAANDMAKGVDVNATGEAFVTGMTASTGQGTSGVYQPNLGGLDDAFLLKLTSAGGISFFTYLGGTASECGSDLDIIPGINEVVMVGASTSSNFPLKNAIDNTYVGGECFVTRFYPDGSNVRYSSYIGGDGADGSKGFDYTTIHKLGGVKVSTNKQPVLVFDMASSAASMSTFLVSPVSFTAVNQSGVNYTYNGGTYGGGALGDYFLTVLDSTAQTALFGSYFGGAENDYPTAGINILQSTGCVVFGGGVHSLPFPVTPGVVQTTRNNSTTPDQPTIVKVCLPEILPVDLLDFKIKETNGNAILDWSTASEQNNSYFEVLKSIDGKEFTSIGRVEGNGTKSSISNYQFIDKKLGSGTTYYRLRQVDYNGHAHFTSIKMINILNLGEISLVPNPGNGLVKLQTNLITDSDLEISVTNEIGQKVYKSTEFVSRGFYDKEIKLSEFAVGVYFIQVASGSQSKVLKYVKE